MHNDLGDVVLDGKVCRSSQEEQNLPLQPIALIQTVRKSRACGLCYFKSGM